MKMKQFKSTLYVTYAGQEEETPVEQLWPGEDIDQASEVARMHYEAWFEETPQLKGATYRVGEFVEVEEDEDNG